MTFQRLQVAFEESSGYDDTTTLAAPAALAPLAFLLFFEWLSSPQEKKRKEKKDYANKVTPVCVNLGRSLHLVQAPGKPPPSNEKEGHKWGSGGF